MLKTKSLLRYLTLFGLLIELLMFHQQTEAKIEIHGFIRLDYEWMDRMPIPGPSFVGPIPTSIPFDDNPAQKHRQFLLDARISRFGLKFIGELCKIKFTGRFVIGNGAGLGEGHGFNAFRSYFRWASIRADLTPNWFFIIGQENTNFGNYDIALPTDYAFVEPNAFPGLWFDRRPLIIFGYQRELLDDGDNGKGSLFISVSAEKQALFRALDEIKFPGKDPNQGADFLLPIFIGRVGWYGWKPLQADIGFAITQNRFIGGANINGLINGKIYQTKDTPWAVQTTIKTIRGPIALFGHAQWLNGFNRFTLQSFPDVVLDPELDLCNVYSWGWYVGATYNFNEGNTYITGMYGWEGAQHIAGSTFDHTAMAADWAYLVNIYHKFWFNGDKAFAKAAQPHWETGIEFKRLNVRNFNHVKGHIDIIQGLTMYIF